MNYTALDLNELYTILRNAGMSNNEIATWVSTPTSWLSGEIPYRLLTSDAERVKIAATRFVSNIIGGNR